MKRPLLYTLYGLSTRTTHRATLPPPAQGRCRAEHFVRCGNLGQGDKPSYCCSTRSAITGTCAEPTSEPTLHRCGRQVDPQSM